MNYYYVTEGGAGVSCQSEEDACGSISEVASKMNFDSTIYICSETLKPETARIFNDYMLDIVPLDEAMYTSLTVEEIKNEDGSLSLFQFNRSLDISRINFVISDGDLTPTVPLFLSLYSANLCLRNCSFKRGIINNNDVSSPLSSELISSNKSDLYFYNCSFDNFEFIDKPLCSLPGELTMSGCNFTNIIRRDGNGSLFDIDCRDGMNIDSSHFYNCTCMNGNGGAMYARQYYYDVDAKFNNIEADFKNCQADNNTSNLRNNIISNADEIDVNEKLGHGGALYFLISCMNIFNLTINFGTREEGNKAIYANNSFIESDYLDMTWKKGNISFADESLKDSEDYLFCFE